MREIVGRRVLAKHTNNLRNYREQNRPLYRSKEERRTYERPDKSNWFRNEGATATITVPFTRGSELAKELRNALIGTGPRGTQVKVLERPGPKIMSGVARNNPFVRKTCNRQNCPLLMTGENCNEQCWKEGIVYSASCNRCYEQQLAQNIDPINSMYIGESSRTLFTRSNQHIGDYKKASQRPDHDTDNDAVSSWMWDHAQVHGGILEAETDYNFGVICNYRDPFTRQVAEAVRIQKALKYGLHYDVNYKEVKIKSLNRKGEYFSPIE